MKLALAANLDHAWQNHAKPALIPVRVFLALLELKWLFRRLPKAVLAAVVAYHHCPINGRFFWREKKRTEKFFRNLGKTWLRKRRKRRIK